MSVGARDTSPSDPAGALVAHLGPLTQVLDEAIAEAIGKAEAMYARFDHRRFGFVRPLGVRLDTRLALEARDLPLGWQVSGDPRLMGQLILQMPGVMTLRFLKGNPVQPGLVPQAGHNAERRAYWRQDALVEWPDQPAEPLGFLLVWNYLDPNRRDEGFSLHVAHPVSPGSFGQRVPCDLLVEVPRGGTMFEELAPFSHEEDEDLFAVEVAEEDQQ